MKIFLLDRNAVSTIKRKLEGKTLLPVRDQALRVLDNPGNFVSPLLSIIEGQTGSRENKQQMQNTLISETRAISSFFKYAKTDCSYLIDNIDVFSDTFSNHSVDNWDNYVAFIIKIQALLYQPISKLKRPEYRDKILGIASASGVMFTHPIVICALSMLYGCAPITNVFKPKPNQTDEQRLVSAYNALNDVMVISWISIIQAIDMEDSVHGGQKIRYFTFDDGLEFLLKSIVVRRGYNQHKEHQKVATITDISYKRRLFPDLNQNMFEELTEYLLSRQV
jgi:hypothetical protein